MQTANFIFLGVVSCAIWDGIKAIYAYIKK